MQKRCFDFYLCGFVFKVDFSKRINFKVLIKRGCLGALFFNNFFQYNEHANLNYFLYTENFSRKNPQKIKNLVDGAFRLFVFLIKKYFKVYNSSQTWHQHGNN